MTFFLLVTYLLYQLLVLRLLIKVFTPSVKPARFFKPDEPIHWNDPNQNNDSFTYDNSIPFHSMCLI